VNSVKLKKMRVASVKKLKKQSVKDKLLKLMLNVSVLRPKKLNAKLRLLLPMLRGRDKKLMRQKENSVKRKRLRKESV